MYKCPDKTCHWEGETLDELDDHVYYAHTRYAKIDTTDRSG